MAPDFPTPEHIETPDDSTLFAADSATEYAAGPSLPIILFSAAGGLGVGVIAFYVTYRSLLLELPLSAGITTLTVLAVLSMLSGGLSALIRSNALLNTLFSCGLIVLMVLFFGFCSLLGALSAALIWAIAA